MGCSHSKMVAEPSQDVTQPATEKRCVALYDYKARGSNDLSFKKKETLQILDETTESWWYARNQKGHEGCIPCNYVAPLASLFAEPWYFGKLSRAQAEKMLKHAKNQTGSFLVRDSDSKAGQYALAVRHDGEVKQYLIGTFDIGGFYIGATKFNNLQELVKHFTTSMDGLCCYLTKPCAKIQKPVIEGLTKDKWEIPRKELKKDKLLGRGQFGEVFKGYWNRKTVVAIKTLKANSADVDQFLKEAQLMKKLVHHKLVQLYGVCSVNEPIFIVTELMKNGSLLDYLQTTKGKQLSINVLIDMGAQVAEGMAFLERKNYIHRDLAARNVLVGERNIVKIADFGLARAIPDNVYVMKLDQKLPIKWMAPEAVNYSRYTIKSDVWSFGIFLTELVTYGQSPYPNLRNHEVIDFLNRDKRMECPKNCPESLYALMLQCWHREPLERPTFESLNFILDDFFSSGTQYS